MSEAPKIEPLGCDEWDFLRDDDSAPLTDLADALAAALRITRDRYISMCHSEFDGVWNAEDFDNEVKEADAALAAWEGRK